MSPLADTEELVEHDEKVFPVVLWSKQNVYRLNWILFQCSTGGALQVSRMLVSLSTATVKAVGAEDGVVESVVKSSDIGVDLLPPEL
jgi:hypothetical protein